MSSQLFMIYVYITKELKPFETDIRDLCLAFFTLQKITYIFEDAGAKLASPNDIDIKEVAADTIRPNDIVVKDYYSGSFDEDRLTIKNNLKRELYNYLSNLTGKKLLWGTLTGIRPVTIVTKLLEERELRNLPIHYEGSHSLPVLEGSQNSPVLEGLHSSPVQEGSHSSPVQEGSHSSPVQEGSQNSPVQEGSHSSPVQEGSQEKPLQQHSPQHKISFAHSSHELCERQADNDIKECLKKEYYISDEKADELIKIAKKEIEILNRDEIKDYKNSYSIYVGVPFCKSTCLYCSFTSYNIEKFGKYVDRYLDTLERDFEGRIKIMKGSYNSSTQESLQSINKLQPFTLYIGGGTPTSLDEKAFERLLTIIDKYVDKSKCVEYTIEAGRADTINREKLLIMKKHGVTRISINPQSFNQKTLDLIGRKHTTEDVVEKFKLARDLGFDNINMDIILGLPNEHLIDVLKTLNGIRKLKPDSLTIHSLALKRAARLNYELESWTKNYYLAGVGKKGLAELAPTKGRLNQSLQEGKREIDKMFRWSERLAKFLKLNPYYLYRQKNIAGNLENVGYAKDKKECIYNIMMMSERHSVYGFGTGTTKEVFYEKNGKRIESEEGYKSVIDYCERVGG